MSNIQLANQVFYKSGEEWELGFPVKSKYIDGKLAYGVVEKAGGDVRWCYEDEVKPVS